MIQKIDDIKFGLLSEYDLMVLKDRIKREEENRKKNPTSYIKVICFDDGSEGFYCKLEDFGKIPADELKAQILQTLEYGSSCGFSLEEMEKDEYEDNCQRYEWAFDDDEEHEE